MKKNGVEQDKWEFKSSKWLLLIFIFAAIILIISGVFYLQNEKVVSSTQALKQLQNTSVLKGRQIEAWRNERLSDAREIAQSPFLQNAVFTWINRQGKNELKSEIQQMLQVVIHNNPDCVNILITDTNGQTLLSGKTGAPHDATTLTAEIVREVIKTNHEIFGNLYKNIHDRAIYADIACPIFNNRHEIAAVILFSLNADVFLFPILKDMIYDSTTEESFLFEKAGDSVLYLTNLRNWPNAALSLTVPLTNNENPAVRAVKEGPGFYEGKGYHGQKVLEYIQPINGSSWFLASKIDQNELYQPVHQRVKAISVILLLLFLTFSALLYLVMTYRRKHFYMQLLEEERKKAALKSHFEYVVKYANDIILLEDENLNIIEVNQRAQQTYQYSLEELLNMKITDLVAPDSRHQVETRLKNITQQDGAIIESKHQRKDGSLFDVEISARIIEVNGRKFLHQVIRDITERKQTEIALAESEERFRTTLYSTGDAIITTDINGHIRYMNPVAEGLTGWKEDEAVGKPIREVFCIYDEDTREEVGNPVDKVLDKGMIIMLSNHTFLKSKNGTEIPIGDSGAPIRNTKGEIAGVVLVFRNQTNEREAQRKIRESEEKYRKAFQTSPDAVNINRMDGLYVEINEGFTNLTGFTREEVIGKFSTEIDIWAIPKDREILIAELKKKGFIRNLESKFRCKDGSLKTSLMSANLVTLNNEPHILSITRDITDRNKAEESLRENKERWESLFNNSPNAIAVYQAVDDGTDFIFTDFNLTAQKTDNLNHDEVIGKRISELFPAADQVGLLDVFRKVWQTGKTECLNSTFYKDNRIEGWRENIIYKLNAGEIVAIYIDTTERELARKALSKSEEKFRKLFDDHAAVKLIIDPETGNIVEANKAGLVFYGWTKQELTAMNLNQLNALASEDIKREIERALTNNQNFFEFEHRLKDGSIKDVAVFSSTIEIDGKNYLHSIVQDITNSKQAEKQLKLLGRAIDQNPVSIVITNINGDIQYVNPKFTEVTGYTYDEVLGENPRMLQSGEHNPEFYKDLWNTILTGADWHGEFHDKKKNGEHFWESAVISPVFDDSGTISSFVAVKEDITEKKKNIQELIVAKEHAEESDRLKTAFLTNISHEIRTPMNGILGFAELLKMPGLSGDQQQEYIGIIKKSSDRMLNIINDIVDISKIESGLMKVEMKEFNINEQTEYIYSFFNPRAEKKGIRLICKNGLPDKDALITTDKEKVNAVLINLVKNAIKFTDDGAIEFGYTQKQGNRLSGESEISDGFEFFVKDTGIGIPKDRQLAIFDRFVQADIADTKAYQGAGLGLSISKAYIEMLGGKIWVESEEGKGSVFYFSVPNYAKPEEKTVDPDNISDEAIKIKKLKILIVEDDAVSELFLSILLKAHNNNEVLKAHSGDEAITLCRNNPDIDLVMMDIKMSVMDGHETASEIRKFNTEVIIIAQTAFSLAGDREKALAAGCNDYISKPIQKDVLRRLIEKYFKS